MMQGTDRQIKLMVGFMIFILSGKTGDHSDGAFTSGHWILALFILSPLMPRPRCARAGESYRYLLTFFLRSAGDTPAVKRTQALARRTISSSWTL